LDDTGRIGEWFADRAAGDVIVDFADVFDEEKQVVQLLLDLLDVNENVFFPASSAAQRRKIEHLSESNKRGDSFDYQIIPAVTTRSH
jgi:hypothetical protein